MKQILVLGGGSKAGAWKVRGEQLGKAIGAVVLNGLNNANLVGFDLVVAVKRPILADVQRIQASGIPIVWDVVDAWPQPIGNWWPKETCMNWLKAELRRLKPIGVVATTTAMAEDCGSTKRNVLVLPHHARPGLERTPIRDAVKTVGYEGGLQHLGGWEHRLRDSCEARGLTFDRAAASLNTLDIVVAMREPDGYAVRNWKSNIKLANAQASGTPCILNRELGYMQSASGAELWADSNKELEAALDELISENGMRQVRSDKLYTARPKLEVIADTYRAWLNEL